MRLSIIIPIFNEAITIERLLKKVLAVPVEKELILVNDGSTDSVSQVLGNYRNHPQIRKIIDSAINRGKGASIRSALPFVTGEVTVIQDADLELDPQDL